MSNPPTALESSLKHLYAATTVQHAATDALFLKYAIEDMAKWRTIEGDANAERRFMTIAFTSDHHLPYQRSESIELAAIVLQAYRGITGRDVDIITTGNDVFEFSNISRFEDRRMGFMQAWDNDINRPLEAHNALLSVWRSAAPNARYLWLPANHDNRLRDHLYSTIRDLAGYTYSHWIQDLRSQGVWYVTPVIDTEAFIHLNRRYTLTHGHIKNGGGRTISSVLTNMLAMWNYQRTVVFGHYHQHHKVTYPHLEDGYTVEAHAVGCLCRLQPSYRAGKPRWNNGMALIHYEVGDRATGGFIENLLFEEYNGYLRTIFRGNEYRVKLSKKEAARIGNQYS